MNLLFEKTPAAKLPVMRTIAEGLAALRPAWRQVIGLAAFILIIEIALDLLPALTFRIHSEMLESHTDAASLETGDVLFRLLRALVELVLYINLLLAIARLVLFSEPPTVTSLVRWGRRQWRLLGIFVLIALVAATPNAIAALFSPYLGSFLASPAAVTAFLALYALCWLWATGWLSLVIPIVASDDSSAALDKAWHIAVNNRFRLMGVPACILGGVLIAIGSAEIFETFFYVNPLQFGGLGYVLAILLAEAIYIVYAASAAAAYLRLTGMVPERT